MQLLKLCLILMLVPLASAQKARKSESPTRESLRGVSIAPRGVVWASGTHSTYLISSDWGRHWESGKVSNAPDLDFRDVQGFSATHAYLMAAGPGDKSRLYATNDGHNWQMLQQASDPASFYDCMAFWDDRSGILLGDPVKSADGKSRFELLATEDGEHWRSLPESRRPEALDGEGAFAASGSCIATSGSSEVWFVSGGTHSRIFHSGDRGATWSVAASPIQQGPASAGTFSIAAAADHAIIAGGDYKNPTHSSAALATSDGDNWFLSTISPQWYLSSVVLTKKGFLAAGTHGVGYAGSMNSKLWSKTWDWNLNALAASGKRAVGVGPDGLIVTFSGLK